MTKARVNKIYAEIPEQERLGLEGLAKLVLEKPTETAVRRVVVEYYLMRQLAGEQHVSEK